MPIVVDAELRRLNQQEFGAVAYQVMECVFQIHATLGRFFDEDVYRDAIACRLPSARKEVPITVRFDTFCKEYCMDLLVDGAAVFELKTAEAFSDRHHSQLINYLLLAELPHGKLVNLRSERVQHRFVNTSLTRADRSQFSVDAKAWNVIEESHQDLAPWLEGAVQDWGTGLERRLYEEAVVHFLGGPEKVLGKAGVMLDGQEIQQQPVLWAGRETIIRVTTLDPASLAGHEEHLRRLVNHTHVVALQWINVGNSELTFKTIHRNR
jgi:GxxExxY protein